MDEVELNCRIVEIFAGLPHDFSENHLHRNDVVRRFDLLAKVLVLSTLVVVPADLVSVHLFHCHTLLPIGL